MAYGTNVELEASTISYTLFAMKTLVTDATGFVRVAVARALVQTGAEVQVLARPDSDLRNLDGLSVERVTGDLRDPASLRTVLAGCRHLYHVAAHYALWAKDPSIFYNINVAGTRNLLAAARAVGVERTVYCNAIGLPQGDPRTRPTTKSPRSGAGESRAVVSRPIGTHNSECTSQVVSFKF